MIAPRLIRVAQVALLALCLSGQAQALQMLRVPLEGGGQALLLQDCEEQGSHPCSKPYERQVSHGDGQRLDDALRAGRYAEVWLNSGGGDSAEGQRIGIVLRRHGMAVRIRSGHLCASACTVAFLGGVLRTIEDGGRYLVHARSAVRNEIPEEMMKRFLAAPGSELERYVLTQRRAAREFIADRLTYLQTMIGGAPDRARYAALVGAGLELRPAYLDSAEFAADVARIRVEGNAAVHSVVMNQERASFDEALANLRPHLPELGSRAAPAHRMMEAMFSTAIIRTADLTPETLVKLGFVTPLIGR